MEEGHRASTRYRGRDVVSKHASPPKSPYIHQPRNSHIPVLLNFYGIFIIWAELIKSLTQIVDSPSSPSLLHKGQKLVVGLKIPTL